MKSQDIGLLLKLVSLQDQESQLKQSPNNIESLYTARALEQETGISKSQVNLSINRCYHVGLLKRDRHCGVPRVNVRALEEFISYGLKYVFPAKMGELTRGVPTAFAAPVLSEKLMSAGELPPVWPDAKGKAKGLTIEPLFKSVVIAIQEDQKMYALLALVDAIRVGQPREANLAKQLLKEQMGITQA